jgi:hypothetical protein
MAVRSSPLSQPLPADIVRFDAGLQTKMRSSRHECSHRARNISYRNYSQNEFPAIAEHSYPFSTLHPLLLP